MLNIKYFGKVLREKITKCLIEERQKSVKLDKRLFELELEMFEYSIKEIKSKPGRPSKSLSKLEEKIRLYHNIMDVIKKIKDIKNTYLQYYDEETEMEFV